jgi:[acyl-carrier-protein] S-malonyltransferase
MTVAWLFPGQGSQYVGMAHAWSLRSADARDALAEADAALGFPVSRLIAHGPAEELAETRNQQPAVLAASVAIMRAAAPDLPPPDYVAGHSLGEYTALVACQGLAYDEALRLVRERGRLMAWAGERNPGKMAAVLGLDDSAVEAVCCCLPMVQVANYNCPGQVVISGTGDAVERASALLAERGAKRIVPLPITIAAHSGLMAPVADAFGDVLARAPLREPAWPLIGNVTARPLDSVPALRTELSSQLTSPVRWADTIRWLAGTGVDAFYEIGPKNVLTELARRTLKAQGVTASKAISLSEPPASGH